MRFNCILQSVDREEELKLWHIVQANIIGLLVFILILYLAKMTDYSRKMLFVFFCVNVVAEIGFRNVLRWILRKYRKQGYNQKHILLVGYSRAAIGYLDRGNTSRMGIYCKRNIGR